MGNELASAPWWPVSDYFGSGASTDGPRFPDTFQPPPVMPHVAPDPKTAQPAAIGPHFGIESEPTAVAQAKSPVVDRAAMSKTAAEIFKACDGWGTDEDSIHAALRGKSPAEIAVLREEYAKHYGVDLEATLDDELGSLIGVSRDVKLMRAELTGDPIEVATTRLMVSLDHIGPDTAEAMNALRDIDPAQLAKVKETYQKRSVGNRGLDAAIGQMMKGDESEEAIALASGKTDSADAIALDRAMNGTFLGLGFGTDEDAVNSLLTKRKGKDAVALRKAYDERTKRTLDADLGAELDADNGDRELSMALLEGNDSEAAAARIHSAAQGMGTNEEAIFAELEVEDPEKRKAIIDAYENKHGKLDAMLDGELEDEQIETAIAKMTWIPGLYSPTVERRDRERARQLVNDGTMDPAFALHYAMAGVGTDDEMLQTTLGDLNPEQAKGVRARYEERYGTALAADLESELSGREKQKITPMIEGGKDLSVDEQLERADSDYEFERGSGAGTLDGVVDLFGYDAGTHLDIQHAKLAALQAQREAGIDVSAQLEETLGYAGHDVDAYRTAKDTVAENAALAAGATLATAATLGTGTLLLGSSIAASSYAPLTAMAGATAFGVGQMGTKRLISGDTYGSEAFGADLAINTTNIATAGLASTAPVAAFANQSFLANALVGTGVGVVNGGVSTAVDGKSWRGKDAGPGRAALNIGANVIGNVAGGVAQGTINPNSGRGALGGLVSGMVSSLPVTAASDGAFDGRAEDVIGRFGKNALAAGIPNAANAYVGLKFAKAQEAAKAANAANAANAAAVLPTHITSTEPIVTPPIKTPGAPAIEAPPALAPVIEAPATAPVLEVAPTPAPIVEAPAPVIEAAPSPASVPIVEAPAPVIDAAPSPASVPIVEAPAPIIDAAPPPASVPIVEAPAPVIEAAPSPVIDAAPVVDTTPAPVEATPAPVEAEPEKAKSAYKVKRGKKRR